MKDHYSTLGIQKGASEDEIKKAYRQLAKQWHPDKNSQAGAEEKFKEIGAAYEILKCPDKRRIWEREYDFSKIPKEPRSNPAPGGSQSKFYQSNFKTYANYENSGNKNKGTSGRRFSYSYEQGPGKTKFSFFFTDSDYEDNVNDAEDTNRREKTKSKGGKTPRNNRSFSFSGPSGPNTRERTKWDNDWNGAEQANKNRYNENGFSFNFNVFNDGDMGFKAFFNSPFEPNYADAPSFAFSDDEEDLEKARQERTKQWRESSQKYAGTNGDPDWYDWSRGADDDEESYDEDEDMKSSCAYCGRNMNSEMLLRHESKCRVLMNGEYYNGEKNWRERHDDLLNMLRQSRRASMDSQKNKKPTTPPPANKNDLITCKYCFRSFNHKAASKHIQFCEQKMKETGRPYNPLGKGAEARDYMSKNYAAREYAKTIPKPGTATGSRRNSRVESEVNIEDLGSDTEGDNINFQRETSFPDINGGNNKPFMESPFTKTRTGLHPSVTKIDPGKARRNSDTKRPGSNTSTTKKNTRKKSPKIDVNMDPNKVNSGTPGNSGCYDCERKYGKNKAKFICSCGTKRAL